MIQRVKPLKLSTSDVKIFFTSFCNILFIKKLPQLPRPLQLLLRPLQPQLLPNLLQQNQTILLPQAKIQFQQ